MCQPVTVRLVFKIKTNKYFSCFIWHADIHQNIVNYNYKNQDTKQYKILNQIWKTNKINLKLSKMKKRQFLLLIYLKKFILSVWSGLKTNMRRCRCFLRNYLFQGTSEMCWVPTPCPEPKQLDETSLGGGSEGKSGQVLFQEMGKGKDEAASIRPQNNLKGNIFWFKVM